MPKHKYYTDWNEFWDFYIKSVKQDIGTKKYSVIKNNSSKIATSLERIDDEFRINILDPLIRKAGMIPEKILLKYDPKATTFYSAYSKKRKRFYIGYPTYTKYMCFWEASMKASFRHEMGHILRGDCLLTMPFSKVRNANCCMDIRINDSLDREGLLQVYKCLYFKDKDVELLVPESQFPKIELPYNNENPYIPEWYIIADKFNKANERQKQENKEDNKDKSNQKDSFEIGDYVIIDKKSSEYNGEPGVIVDIDEKGNFVVEGISDEEFEDFLKEVKKQREGIQFVKSGENLGIYTDKEIISAVPEEENQQGEYGDEGDDSPEVGGGEEGDEEEGEEGEDNESQDGEGKGDNNKTPEDIIKEKEQILDDLMNGGVDGDSQGDEVWSDEISDEKEKSETKKESSEKSEDEEKIEGENKEEAEKEKEEEEEMSWSEEQLKKKKEIQDAIADINLNIKIKKSISNFNNIKDKHKDKLSATEISNIDKALEDLEKLI